MMCEDLGMVFFQLNGDLPSGGCRNLADNVLLHRDEIEWVLEDIDDSEGTELALGRRWWLVDPDYDADDEGRPAWYSRLMPGSIWPFLEEWKLPEPVAALRRVSQEEYLGPEQMQLGEHNLRAKHHLYQRVFEPGQWPLSLPEHLTEPGPHGWANFPVATVTFFHPPGQVPVPVGEQPQPLAEVPTYDMPAEVRMRADSIEVRYGALPTFLRGKSFRTLQYELEDVEALEPGSLRATLSLGPCCQLLEGHFEERLGMDEQPVYGMWCIRLGPRDDSVWTEGSGSSLPERMKRWWQGS
jgi:hypothetical protein